MADDETKNQDHADRVEPRQHKRWSAAAQELDMESLDSEEAAQLALREVAESLAKTSKVVSIGLQQANSQGQRLRSAVARVERIREWSQAERKRAVDEISAYFRELHETLKVREEELIREVKGVYDEQDQSNTRRLEELVAQGKSLSKACASAQGFNDGSLQTSIQSLNSPLTTLIEALESTSEALQREDLQHDNEHDIEGEKQSLESRGLTFVLCIDKEIQRELENLQAMKYSKNILVGTSRSIEEAARSRGLSMTSGAEHGTENGHEGYKKAGESKRAYSDRNRISAKKSSSHRKSSMRSRRVVSKVSTGSTHSSMYSNLETTDYHRSVADESGRTVKTYDRNPKPEDENLKESNNTLEDSVIQKLPFTGHADIRGVIYYLGTERNSTEFSNPTLLAPEDPNVIILRASSRLEGDLASLCGFRHEEGSFFETDSALSSWVSIELPLPLKISHYTLGYYIKGEEHIPRNWAFQSSTDNATWRTLMLHENERSLDHRPHIHTWEIQEDDIQPARYFRILQTGPTSSGTLFLVLSLIELYGTLYK